MILGDPRRQVTRPDVERALDRLTSNVQAVTQSVTKTAATAAAGGAAASYQQVQVALLWVISHSLGRYPSVTLVDTAGDMMIADVTYVDGNTIEIRFTAPSAGTAHLN